MVEISLSGSGEGPGKETTRGYSTIGCSYQVCTLWGNVLRSPSSANLARIRTSGLGSSLAGERDRFGGRRLAGGALGAFVWSVRRTDPHATSKLTHPCGGRGGSSD
jgi:hypothetical protein